MSARLSDRLFLGETSNLSNHYRLVKAEESVASLSDKWEKTERVGSAIRFSCPAQRERNNR